MADLKFWLDSYDDIYSDFDPRKYHKRRLSEDFIDEVKASLRYMTDPVDNLVLLLPAAQRSVHIENEIATNILQQIMQRRQILHTRQQNVLNRGIALVLAGCLIMAVDAFMTLKNSSVYGLVALRILMEPASWFLVWNGMDGLIYDYRKAKKETALYNTIGQFQIRFENI